MSRNPTNRRDNTLDADLDPGRNIVIVPSKNEAMLSERQRVDYHSYRKKFLKWLLHFGKNPDRALGYSPYTVYESGYRAAAFDRWVWDENNSYRLPPTTDDADEFMRETAYSDQSQATKGKIEEMLKRYFRWLAENHGTEEWEPQFSFESRGTSQPRDFLTDDERRQIWEAALEHGSIPSYNVLPPSQRSRWQEYISEVLSKPVEEVTQDNWDEVESWKITSLVWTSLDAGLRPVEVKCATLDWVDVDNEVLRIPREDSSKNEDNWLVSLTARTASALERWLDERKNYSRYEETDQVWLTTHGNPYGSKSLGRLLKRLCEDADIKTENRQMSWYAIRHSVGTYMTREEDLAAAQAQLRHKSSETTMKYDQTPVEDRRDALDRMG